MMMTKMKKTGKMIKKTMIQSQIWTLIIWLTTITWIPGNQLSFSGKAAKDGKSFLLRLHMTTFSWRLHTFGVAIQMKSKRCMWCLQSHNAWARKVQPWSLRCTLTVKMRMTVWSWLIWSSTLIHRTEIPSLIEKSQQCHPDSRDSDCSLWAMFPITAFWKMTGVWSLSMMLSGSCKTFRCVCFDTVITSGFSYLLRHDHLIQLPWHGKGSAASIPRFVVKMSLARNRMMAQMDKSISLMMAWIWCKFLLRTPGMNGHGHPRRWNVMLMSSKTWCITPRWL